MEPSNSQEFTKLLIEARDGDAAAKARFFEAICGELRQMAGQLMRNERQSHTLQPTALVNEVWLKLSTKDLENAANRSWFFATAAEAMRHILVDHARRKKAAKRGGGWVREQLDGLAESYAEQTPDLVAVNEALEELGQLDPRPAKIVELRFFGGHSQEGIAKLLDVSLSTVEKDWSMARAWLFVRLGKEL